MDIDDDPELLSLLSEQRHELTTAIATDSDLEFAFQLQLQEAIKISQPSSSSSSSSQQLSLTELTSDSPSGIAHYLAEEIDNIERQRVDRDIVKAETKQLQDNLNRLIHDQVFARQILDVPEREWRSTGDYFEKPYGGTPVSREEVFRVYCKGLVSEGENKVVFGGIGVAICDTRDCCVFELRKPFIVSDGDVIDGDDVIVVEVKALIEGLNAAVCIGINRIQVYFDNHSVYQYFTGKWQPTNNKLVTLVDQLNLIQRKFAYCGPFLMRQNNIKFALQFARGAISSQTTKYAGNTSDKRLLEQCTICFESVYTDQMFSVSNCMHRYCFSCMRKHVEAKLLQGQLPKCPDVKCKSKLEIESCKKFLNPELYDIMSSRVKEESIPATDKVYCPFSKCSALMSKTELQLHAATSSRDTGMRQCVKCRRLFCINCKVPWHDNVDCGSYLKYFANQSSNEAKLKSLATKNRWRQCIKCKNMVELSEGCYHIYCRCGYEFCYTCGAQWINKKPTCNCPIWDERNIIYAGGQNGR
ncbi:E3 ubiquitin-protein ligase RSL1-like [Rutidosis leptorrhynchoides]|uniref:E3 ubiquitin-protein ligase RSL1-like n=1 Tax=Rutidosis leptorrhynchoides TaxID=125765 RepID=UPI003A9A4E89